MRDTGRAKTASIAAYKEAIDISRQSATPVLASGKAEFRHVDAAGATVIGAVVDGMFAGAFASSVEIEFTPDPRRLSAVRVTGPPLSALTVSLQALDTDTLSYNTVVSSVPTDGTLHSFVSCHKSVQWRLYFASSVGAPFQLEVELFEPNIATDATVAIHMLHHYLRVTGQSDERMEHELEARRGKFMLNSEIISSSAQVSLAEHLKEHRRKADGLFGGEKAWWSRALLEGSVDKEESVVRAAQIALEGDRRFPPFSSMRELESALRVHDEALNEERDNIDRDSIAVRLCGLASRPGQRWVNENRDSLKCSKEVNQVRLAQEGASEAKYCMTQTTRFTLANGALHARKRRAARSQKSRLTLANSVFHARKQHCPMFTPPLPLFTHMCAV